ncbi:MFS general substrate transporter [Leucogyrophana mollusca]|uniref:MFS general substrate transporter n=1 Tax=Leucogyrophana mollusca TaxID=85980 RepID=A0ACB8BY54_9AGAM|nr:MFS general substrate transporter [Leucogyrophana mollusca]
MVSASDPSYRPISGETSVTDLNYGSISSTDGPNAIFGGLEGRKRLERKLLRKLDLRVAFLVLIYIMNYMDRNNAAAARLRGLEEDLHMKGRQFNTMISILYVGYVMMQVPSNIFLNYIGKPSIYLSTCMAIWGLISVFTGAAQSYHGALLSRFLLGFVEAAFYPGALFLLSKWYKRDEIGFRTALLTCGSSVSNAFGSLIASGILGSMDGKLGFAAWRWLFFIEGTLTVAVAITAVFILPDFPSTSASWLTPAERALAQLRMEEDALVGDQGETEEVKSASGFVLALTDGKVWWLGVALCSMVASLSFGNFFPTLCATMGYSPTVTLLLCAPPWLLGTATSFVVTRHSDSTGDRFWHITCPLLIGMVGYMIAMSTMNIVLRYISLFIMAQSSVAYVVFLTWVSNSIPRPPSKRAVAIAFINSIATFGNIGASYFWPSSWGPSYWNSYAICMLTSSLSIAMCWAFRRHLRRLNDAAEAEERILGLPKGYRYLL